MILVKRGLDVPISGAPKQEAGASSSVSRVAILGRDYHGFKPTMLVEEGEVVALGQPVMEDKKISGVIFTAPASGRVAAINRGERRAFESLVIEIDDSITPRTFSSHSLTEIAALDAAAVASRMQESGLWTAFRTRPLSKTPAIDSLPDSIFVSIMDTNPLAADPLVVIHAHESAFMAGIMLLAKLPSHAVFVGKAAGSQLSLEPQEKLRVEEFGGVHPAGLVGTHIHFLRPVSAQRVAWTIGYQDVIALGYLFLEGSIWVERVIALAGPQVSNARLVKTRIGASVDELTANELRAGENRVISGSVLHGQICHGTSAFLGRFDNQITVLAEGRDRPMLHYLSPGKDRFSALPIYLSSFGRARKWDFTTTTNGSDRAMVPIGAYEQVMPLDILPTQLLRSLIVGDTQTAQQLGALELDEEDLSLCTFVCPGKYEYGPILRDNLTRIELEG